MKLSRLIIHLGGRNGIHASEVERSIDDFQFISHRNEIIHVEVEGFAEPPFKKAHALISLRFANGVDMAEDKNPSYAGNSRCKQVVGTSHDL